MIQKKVEIQEHFLVEGFLKIYENDSIACLPTTLGELLVFSKIIKVDTNHSLTQILRDLSEDLGIVVVGDSLDDGLSTLGRIARLEDTRTNEDTITAQLLKEIHKD
jgi:hypothetical protein